MHICEAPTPKNLRAPRRRVNSNRRKQTANAEFQKGENGEYWRLMRDGSIAYDGFATLRDENGNIIRSAASMGVKETQIEGSLLKILGVNPNDKEKVRAIQEMMAASGLRHTRGDNPEKWSWSGKRTENYGTTSHPEFRSIDITKANDGVSISLASINKLYNSIGANKDMVGLFINKTYGSAIDMLNYAGDNSGKDAQSILSKVYSDKEVGMINKNRTWYNNVMKNGFAVSTMVTGNVSETQSFGVDSGNLPVSDIEDLPLAAFFREEHTGHDFGGGGSTVQTPGAYWQFTDPQEHRAYFQLFGGDLRMRVMHIKPSEIDKLKIGAIYGSSSGSEKLFDYPKERYGTGTGAHTHFDFTRRLPYNGTYQRQFVDPSNNLLPGSRFNYMFWYKDNNYNILNGFPKSFYRF